MPVNTPRSDYSAFAPKWRRLRDCYDGRDAVLTAGDLYVPKLPGADKAGNESYRLRGNFYNAVQRTVFGMVGLLFGKEVSINKFPDRIKDMLEDITLTSVSTEMFAFTATLETLLIGRYGVLVDMSAEAVATTARPYLVGYPAEQIISWTTAREGGDGVLTRVILREIYEHPDPEDPFVQKECEQYRVLELVNGVYTQQLWRKPDKEFVMHEGPVTPLRRGETLSFIPFVFLGPLHVTAELAKPPLLDMADVNLGHWRNSVDYEYGLHLVALPTPWVAGMRATKPTDEPLKIGPSVVWELEKDGSAGMLEFQGKGMDAIASAMQEKKTQMASLGARLMESEPRVQETAAAVSMRHSGDHATLRTLALAIGQGLSMALQMVTWWMGTEKKPEDSGVCVELNRDYQNVKASSQDIQVALTAVQAGTMSYETFWHLLSTGGWGRDGVTAEEELEQIRKEAPAESDVNPAETLDGDGLVIEPEP